MLDRFDNCWRWGTDPREPGWYRNLRVFRQPAFGDWAGALDGLRGALDEWATRPTAVDRPRLRRPRPAC